MKTTSRLVRSSRLAAIEARAFDVLRNLCGTSIVEMRPAGGVSNDALRAEAGRRGLAEILWEVIPFDWINDSNNRSHHPDAQHANQASFGGADASCVLQHRACRNLPRRAP